MHVRVAVSQKGLARIGKFLLWPIMQRLDKNFHQSDLLEIFITVPCGLCLISPRYDCFLFPSHPIPPTDRQTDSQTSVTSRTRSNCSKGRRTHQQQPPPPSLWELRSARLLRCAPSQSLPPSVSTAGAKWSASKRAFCTSTILDFRPHLVAGNEIGIIGSSVGSPLFPLGIVFGVKRQSRLLSE